jgi:CheY-like chemotaxis protein
MKNILLTSRIGSKPSHTDGFGGRPTVTPAMPGMKEGIIVKKTLSDLRVLVVDDNLESALLSQLFIRKSVQSADTAETAYSAIAKIGEAAENGKYDLVLCDMNLDNGKTGLDVQKEAKTLSPGTIFVFVTGHDRAGFADAFPGQEYPDLVLRKPIKKEALLEFLHQLCDGQLS